jgi:CBS domain containing-hemolysin-like protein
MVLLLSGLLIAASAFFVLLEYALVRVRPARVEMLARKGSRRALMVQEMLAHIDEYLAAIQVGITAIGLALGAVGEPAITAMLSSRAESLLGDLPDAWLRVVSFWIAVGLLAFFQIVLAELVPRSIAIHYAEPLALWGAAPLRVMATFLRLPIRVMSGFSRAVVFVLGMKPASDAAHTVSVDEMRVILGETHEKGAIPLERLLLLENLFDFGSAKASDAMRPREKIAFLSLSRTWAENLAVIREKRFSRYPLCETGPDSIIGFVHVKDLLFREGEGEPDLRKKKRDLLEVSEGEPLERLLKTMPDKGQHMALVKDGSGRVAGVLTLEDIIEELVGEIRDEFDKTHGWVSGELFSKAAVDANLPAADRRAVIRHLVDRLKGLHPELDAEAAFNAVWDRELKFTSAIGGGVLLPHARLPGLPQPLVAVGRFPKAPPLPTPDAVPLRLVFLLLTPLETPVVQLKVLQRIASLLTNETLRRKLLRAKTDPALLELLRTADTLLAS